MAENENHIVSAQLIYATPPTTEQLLQIRKLIADKLKVDEGSVNITEKYDASIGGGFILKVGNVEYDWSTRGRQQQFKEHIEQLRTAMRNDQTADIMSVLQNGVEDFTLMAKRQEIGTVLKVGDGIAVISGMNEVMYGEVVLFDSGVKGMVQNIGRDTIGVILFGKEGQIGEGSRVVRTGRRAGVPAGSSFLGRVVNALGEPIDGMGEIHSDDYRAIEQPAPGIVDRQQVGVPLQTGILAIDSMFPIGRGQRELIIGDRQTGKTSIAVDTIINQKDKDCYCVYVAIGQKASKVASLVNTLVRAEAMKYTIVMCATAAEPASMQYIAPYAATSMAEYFSQRGKDVLIVYDDLSKHAVAYRTLSLLLGRPPGREAYPGDVFYLHSRLLERSARLSAKLGGGSITALPIVETQDGDVSAYIPTNVISITDGQIFLETDLFFSGERPAINVGLSVSRVGGAAQTKAMKKACGTLRIDLAQYREMEVFTQFSSDLDQTTKDMLAQGGALMELLKQPLYHPYSVHDMVIQLVVSGARMLIDVPRDRIADFRSGMLQYFAQNHPEIGQMIETGQALDDDMKTKILKTAQSYKNAWKEQAGETVADQS
ncbi:MAG: F0F1 ATP synthase subunit alpha [Lachnospiraceae bacterium]|jgi:proton translocating ATP synthase F1 alpha subunit|nr:F0F1 ATP synthase subunit alpha [Lachnospiraceae bacterium]